WSAAACLPQAGSPPPWLAVGCPTRRLWVGSCGAARFGCVAPPDLGGSFSFLLRGVFFDRLRKLVILSLLAAASAAKTLSAIISAGPFALRRLRLARLRMSSRPKSSRLREDFAEGSAFALACSLLRSSIGRAWLAIIAYPGVSNEC